MTWEHGRELKSVTYNGFTTTYEYDADGIRTKKAYSDGRYYEYFTIGGQITGEKRYNADGSINCWIRYRYDANGSVYGMSVWYLGDTAWTDYYYVKNLQGDVLQVRRAGDDVVVASYTYDAWGSIISKSGSLAELNPFRYRSYYFDNETWFYYLQSRYYDPEVGRFINADSTISGNPISYYNGTRWTFDWAEGRNRVSASEENQSTRSMHSSA